MDTHTLVTAYKMQVLWLNSTHIPAQKQPPTVPAYHTHARTHARTHTHTHTHSTSASSHSLKKAKPPISPLFQRERERESGIRQLGCSSNKERESIGHAMEPRCCHSSCVLPNSHHSSKSMSQQIGKWLFVSNTSALIHWGISFPLTPMVKYTEGLCVKEGRERCVSVCVCARVCICCLHRLLVANYLPRNTFMERVCVRVLFLRDIFMFRQHLLLLLPQSLS